jgi:hypothetical protein
MERNALINSGGHGSKKGTDPTKEENGEGQFIMEDVQIA